MLARVPVGTFTCVVLYDDEVGREVPSEPHDRRVAAAVSPAGDRPLPSSLTTSTPRTRARSRRGPPARPATCLGARSRPCS
ncbi:hypothetical protein [Nocardioides sp. InS609-2]|uniref:hypothetical protein n=1 Tax=Nocardioides sp. InS609-2 TaxID=2760705 RepID=UPI0020C18478|nr:hypothetical protein [Nocardioides sp. InS609-2]